MKWNSGVLKPYKGEYRNLDEEETVVNQYPNNGAIPPTFLPRQQRK